ncbi:MAG: CatB-related O-acetyltransferase [Propionibacteriaceae bacterium]|jgi:virginiamycin A acetyltransferase|nr:CatB-related O-acetyltransferase [Propionibacteriaceae bacterium]
MTPNPAEKHPVPSAQQMTHIKPTITRPNIIVGDYTYFGDVNFESHVTHHYDFYGDKLIIGKFCQIAAGVEFIMNGSNHKMGCVSTYPFYIMGWDESAPQMSELPVKGNTVIGNDVWIGQNSTILPGVHIGDGAIVGASSVAGSDIEPYSIVVGNPARFVRKRFDDELIGLLKDWKWWDLPYEEIATLIPVLHSGDFDKVKREIKSRLK